MKVEFLDKFNKDISSINDTSVLIALDKIITEVEAASTLLKIHNLKKLKGHRFAYRIRMGNYRIGVFIENNIVEFARFVHRKDIYKVFP